MVAGHSAHLFRKVPETSLGHQSGSSPELRTKFKYPIAHVSVAPLFGSLKNTDMKFKYQ